MQSACDLRYERRGYALQLHRDQGTLELNELFGLLTATDRLIPKLSRLLATVVECLSNVDLVDIHVSQLVLRYLGDLGGVRF